MKGIERTTGKRMDEVVMETLDLPADRFAAISGPNLSKQIADREPAATVVACENLDNARKIAAACTTDYFRAFVTRRRDRLGNVWIAEECGRAGRGHGPRRRLRRNTAAMIETRGLAELTALGEAAGADPKTFAGLAGVGDLIATCGSPLSRNYTFGSNLGKGLSVEEATKVSNGVAEGVPTTDAVVALGKQYGVPTPLATAMSTCFPMASPARRCCPNFSAKASAKNKLSATSRLQIRPHFQVRSFYFRGMRLRKTSIGMCQSSIAIYFGNNSKSV